MHRQSIAANSSVPYNNETLKTQCVTADELSGCLDRTKSASSETVSKFWNRTVSWSKEACKESNLKNLGE